MSLLRRSNILMAPEGDAGGGGGDAGAAPPSPPEPKMSDVMTRLEALGKGFEQVAGVVSQLQERVAQPRQAESDSSEESEYTDPEVRKVVQKEVGGLFGRLQSLQDQMDMAQYNQMIGGLGISEDEQDKIQSTYNEWLKRKITINGQTPTRQDVASFVLGRMAMQQRISDRTKTRDADEQIRESNRNAHVERGGRSSNRGSNLPDPDKLSREDRVKPGGYWEQKLDSEGPW